MSSKTKRARKIAVESAMYDMLCWYVENSGGKEPQTACEDKKSYGGCILRWLEPPIVGINNPVLVEKFIGDSWSLQFVEMQGKLL